MILILVVVIVLLVLFWTTTSKLPPPPPVFLQAQKGGRQRQKLVGGGGGAKGPSLFKAPPAQSPTPGPKKDNYSMIPGLCSDEACVKIITDMRGKNRTCEAGDEYCVFKAGATGQGCLNNGQQKNCIIGLPTGGVECKYTDKDCRKAIRPATQPPPSSSVNMLDLCTDTTLEQCKDTSRCVHYTCKTKEDAQRVSAKNAQLVCKSDQVVKCDTEGNTAFCGCFPYYPDEHGNKGCPDGWVKKGIRAPCKYTAKDMIKSIRVPACKPMIRTFEICELPPPTLEAAPQGCVDVSTGGCKASKTCLEYKCKTRGDMERVDETNIKMTCGKDTTLKCRRFYEEPYENEVRCNCEEILPGDYDGKPCPDGLVVKNKRVEPPNFRSIPGLPYDVCALP